MKKLVTIKSIFVILILVGYGSINAQTIITGHVYDEDTKAPLENVKVEAKDIEGGSIALTNNDGKYTIVISDQQQVRLYFSKENYQTSSDLLLLNENNLIHDKNIRLLNINLEMTDFVSNDYIKGRVYGLDEGNFDNYKVVLYVLTDKWYIHPFAENSDGRGYASIKTGGNWEISTIWRGYQAYKLAILLVEITSYPSSKINGDSDNALLIKIPNKAYKIINAPKGI